MFETQQNLILEARRGYLTPALPQLRASAAREPFTYSHSRRILLEQSKLPCPLCLASAHEVWG